MRASGILMHITSLPSPYGIGTLGQAAYDFVDFLARAKQSYWQVLPLGQTSFGDSPYQSVSAFAMNPYFIDLDLLCQEGLLTKQELEEAGLGDASGRVDYALQHARRFSLLRLAYARGYEQEQDAVNEFLKFHVQLRDYALFMAIKQQQEQRPWSAWPERLRLRNPSEIKRAGRVLREDVSFYAYLQFLCFRQWGELRKYAKKKGIALIGDIPIYVPYDSADVWAHPELFELDEEGRPLRVAGCPPDAFSENGQLWGNPLYRWPRLRVNGFRWYLARISAMTELTDVIRIDHFRGLESYWAVPYGQTTARDGVWEKGPGLRFIQALKRHFPRLPVIAEDLGFLTPAVHALREQSGYPGMKVLQFAFDPDGQSEYLPHRYTENCVCYTGTHDNPTLSEWLQAAPDEVIAFAMKYLQIEQKSKLHDAILQAGLQSKAKLFIAPIQDYLHLNGRMNEPGVLSPRNWSWRLAPSLLTPEVADKIAHMTEQSGRAPDNKL